ncbi:MAG: hypothetical protein KAS32_09775, partial [Candidatus Peribacteraceae bacterium]|nr:hypothetical protein [Candidatus Peribacteraceae bacterium]
IMKLQTSYLSEDGQIIKHLEEDGRVRPSFRDTGTATGRLSCSQPNLQQLPKGLCLSCGEELDKCKCGFTGNLPVRECFIVEEGMTMITCDYSGQEVAVAAQQSKDPTLIDALNKGQDMHLRIANQFYNLGIPEEELYKTHPEFNNHKHKFHLERTRAKTITFGLMYGKGAYGFAKDFDIPEDEAQGIVDKYFDSMPMLKEAIEKAHREIDETGMVTSMAGRKRHFEPEINIYTGESGYNGKAYRQAFNFLIQGFSADMMRRAMIKVRELGNQNPDWGLKTIATVHDEAVYEVRTEYKDDAGRAIKTAFEGVVNFVVPVTGDVSMGQNYWEAK